MKKTKANTDKKLVSRSEFAKEGLKQFAGYFSDIDSKFNKFKDIVKETLNPDDSENINNHIPKLRPPGAVVEEKFLQLCDGCEECADACEYGVLKLLSDENDSNVTPIIIPSENPCYMCKDFLCIEACNRGALLKKNKKKGIGNAYIVKKKCFAYNNQMCDYCFDRCPEQGKAIIMENGKPIIITEKCTGCGMCEYICPAPDKGVIVLPTRKNK